MNDTTTTTTITIATTTTNNNNSNNNNNAIMIGTLSRPSCGPALKSCRRIREQIAVETRCLLSLSFLLFFLRSARSIAMYRTGPEALDRARVKPIIAIIITIMYFSSSSSSSSSSSRSVPGHGRCDGPARGLRRAVGHHVRLDAPNAHAVALRRRGAVA